MRERCGFFRLGDQNDTMSERPIMDSSAGWITAIVGGLSAIAGAAVKWAADRHRERKEDRVYEHSILREVIDKQDKQIKTLIGKVEHLQASEAECQRRFAVMQERLENTERRVLAQEQDISLLREQLGK